MAWEPLLYTKSRKVVAANLLAHIKANMADALAWAHGSPLEDFRAVYNSKVGRVATKLPVLMVARAGTKAATRDDGLGLDVAHVFGFEMKIKGSDPEEMNERADDYLTALDSVIRNIPYATLFEGLEAAMPGMFEIEVSDEDLDEAREGMVQMPSLIATIKLLEVTQYA